MTNMLKKCSTCVQLVRVSSFRKDLLQNPYFRIGTAYLSVIVFSLEKSPYLHMYVVLENSKFVFVKICGRAEQLEIKVFSFSVSNGFSSIKKKQSYIECMF